MTKVMDYLVDNYIYVAAISGFLIIVLIGFLVKTSKSKKPKKSVNDANEKEDNSSTIDTNTNNIEKTVEETPLDFVKKEENEEVSIVNDVPEDFADNSENTVVEEVVNVEIANVEKPLNNEEISSPIIEDIQSHDEMPSMEEYPIKEPASYYSDNYGETVVEPSKEKYQIVSEGKMLEPTIKEEETFKLDETILFDKKELDDSVDIVDFSELNKFESDNRAPHTIE